MAWEDMLSIMAMAQEDHEEFVATPPVACPNDGTVLQEGPNGELHCMFDGWIWDGTGGARNGMVHNP